MYDALPKKIDIFLNLRWNWILVFGGVTIAGHAA